MKNTIFKTLFFSLFAITIFMTACSEQSVAPVPDIPDNNAPAVSAYLKNSVHVALPGYRGVAQSSDDCPTGMEGCLFFDFRLMPSLDEGLQFLENEEPSMVLAKITILSDESAKLEMVAAGAEYPHNDTEEDVLVVKEGGIDLPAEVADALGAAGINVLAGEYQIYEKSSSGFWSGYANIAIEVAAKSATVQIGVVKEGKFEFTVTQDQLENNFGLNVTKNLGQGGELEEAIVYFPDEENGLETPMFHLRGQLDDGESSADVYWEATETDGIVVISGDPVGESGICWGCPVCIKYQGGCKCIWGPWGQCKKVIDPTIYWYD
ncbi:MAG: hypothetical protein AAFZ15_14125 [Bacteroidota bacterium]